MNVLEVAGGTGLLSAPLARHVRSLDVTDFSPEMHHKAREKHSAPNLHFAVQGVTGLSYEAGSFGAVLISNAQHVTLQPEQALREIHRPLKQDCILFVPTFTTGGNAMNRMKMRIMKLSGIRFFHIWDPNRYLQFLASEGFQ